MTDCTICCFPYNKRTRKPIECLKCKTITCSVCVKKYLLGVLEDPHCMSCKHPWDIFFTNQNLPTSFMNKEWKASRSQLLFNREKSFFPETMPLVAQEIEKEKLYEELRELEKKEQEIKTQKNRIFLRIGRIGNANNSGAPANTSSSNFNIRQCPFANCKGFLDSKTGHCVICTQFSCLKCNIVIGTQVNPDHVCSEDDLKTWEEISKHSKPCPNCATRIQKVSGCSQMWCPGCHNAFNWNTGTIEKGAIHNPHYYEWANRIGVNPNGEEVNDHRNNCNQHRIWNYYNYRLEGSTQERSDFRHLHQSLNHIVHDAFPNLRNKLNMENTDLRIKFLRNKMDEDQYKKMLIYRERNKQKGTRIIGIYETLEMLGSQILRNYLSRTSTISDCIYQGRQLEQFANDSIAEINANFKSKISKIVLIPV